jgi:sarcosine oxidase, subunit beta
MANRHHGGSALHQTGSLRAGAAVIVIGGGVTGLSAGWWLARSGIDVLILERGIVGWEASGRNGGGTTHHFSPLFAEEQRLWPRLDDMLGYPTEFRPGRIRIALDDAQYAAHERAALNAAREGFEWERLDGKQLRALAPLVGPNHDRAIYFHFGGHANPHRTVQAFAWAIEDEGGIVQQHAEVTGIETRGGRAVSVKTTIGNFGCEALVIAAGVQTERLAALVGAVVPTALARTEILATEALEPMPVGGVDGNGLYGRQTLRGNLIYGGGPHEWLPPLEAGFPASDSTPLVQNIAKRMVEMFPLASHTRAIRAWAGIVENTPDGRPIIQRLMTPSNVVIATMSGIGFGLSPATGRAIAELVMRGSCNFADLSSFALSRFDRIEPNWREQRGWIPCITEHSQSSKANGRLPIRDHSRP